MNAHFAHFLSFAHCLVLHIANKTDLPGWQPTQSHPRVWVISAYLLKRSKLTDQMSEYWACDLNSNSTQAYVQTTCSSRQWQQQAYNNSLVPGRTSTTLVWETLSVNTINTKFLMPKHWQRTCMFFKPEICRQPTLSQPPICSFASQIWGVQAEQKADRPFKHPVSHATSVFSSQSTPVSTHMLARTCGREQSPWHTWVWLFFCSAVCTKKASRATSAWLCSSFDLSWHVSNLLYPGALFTR